MTIDEAIAKYKEITNVDANCPAHCNISCDKCVQESKQFAEWLEELKAYREIGTVEECMNSVLDIQKAYNKAIDDFKKALFKNSERARPVGWLGYSEIVTCEKIYDIAEQLKAGIENEQSI